MKQKQLNFLDLQPADLVVTERQRLELKMLTVHREPLTEEIRKTKNGKRTTVNVLLC